MITLELIKPHEFKAGEVVHLKILHIDMTSPGRWRLTVKDVTPLPGAEIGYACAVCGIVEEAQEDGSLPEGWAEMKYEEGSCFFCTECQGCQICRVCGCTDEHGCVTDEGTCHWAEDDLCSACVGKEKTLEEMEEALEESADATEKELDAAAEAQCAEAEAQSSD